MKKIAFFIYDMYTSGGTERVVSIIANQLVEENEVIIFSLYKTQEKPFYQLHKNIKLVNILEKELPRFNYIVPYLKYVTQKKMKKYNIDVLISAGMKFIPITIGMRKYVDKFIAWEHMNSYMTERRSWFHYGRMLAGKYADKIVVLTKRDRENNIKMFGTNPDKIITIYNPIEGFENSHSYDITSKKILSCGRFVPQKGFDMLVDVAQKVFEKHSDWEWHIYGDGEDMPKIQEKIQQKELQKNIKLMGQTNQMNELYKEYAMFVMTSRYEGFAMVNIEAHYSKLPIISFNCNCGPDEIIQDGVNGYLIDCFDINQMAEKINFLIEHDDIRRKMSDSTMIDKEKLQLDYIMSEWRRIIEWI